MGPSYHQSTMFLACNATPDPPAPEMEHKRQFCSASFSGSRAGEPQWAVSQKLVLHPLTLRRGTVQT